MLTAYSYQSRNTCCGVRHPFKRFFFSFIFVLHPVTFTPCTRWTTFVHWSVEQTNLDLIGGVEESHSKTAPPSLYRISRLSSRVDALLPWVIDFSGVIAGVCKLSSERIWSRIKNYAVVGKHPALESWLSTSVVWWWLFVWHSLNLRRICNLLCVTESNDQVIQISWSADRE